MLYKCKVCGGELAFDPASGKLKCKYCDSVYDIQEYEQEEEQPASQTGNIPAMDLGFDKATDQSDGIQQDLRVYQCPHCGAEVVTDKTTAATNCIFCNTPMMVQEQMQGDFRPEYVIPFEVDKKKVGELYEQYIQNKPFYPEAYSSANVIEKIKPVYLPFWLYDLKAHGRLSATGEKCRTITTRDWIITNHDVFSLEREGAMNFSRLPAVASSKTPKDAMDSIEPFDYSKIRAFDTGYLPGFMAERYDVDAPACLVDAKSRAEKTFEQNMRTTLDNYSNVAIQEGTLDIVPKENSYALLPAYMLFMDFKNTGEDPLIAINGQTGKIAGNVPVDKKKRLRYFLSRFLWIFAVCIIFSLVFIYLI